MLFRCFCPRCGQKKEYIAEQVGQTSYCDNCGTEFEMQANNGRVVWQLVGATFFVVALIGGFLTRAYWRTHPFDRLPVRSAAIGYDHSAFNDD